MNDDELKRILSDSDGDDPSAHFVERLSAELGARVAMASGSDGTPSTVDPINVSGGARRRTRLLVAAAASFTLIAAAAAGTVVLSADDDGVPDLAVTTFTQATPGSIPPAFGSSDEPTWEFDVEIIDVEAGNTVAVGPDTAWVASSRSPILTEIDLATNTPGRVFAMPSASGPAAYGFESVWVSHLDGTLSRVSPVDGEIVATFVVGSAGWIEPGVDAVWVGAGVSAEIVRIDPSTNDIEARIPTGDAVGAVMANDYGLWARTLNGDVLRIDPDRNELEQRVSTPSGGLTLVVTTDALWAPGGSTGVVYRLNPVSGALVGEVDVGTGVTVGGIHAVGGSVWIRFSSDCVEDRCRAFAGRIDPAAGEVVATHELPEGWGAIGVSVGADSAWTASADAVARISF